MNFLKSIKFKEDHYSFKKGDEFEFRPGVNLLVGDQGVGKSTLLQLLTNPCSLGLVTEFDISPCDYSYHDAEKMSARIKDPNPNDSDNYVSGIMSRFVSHGEYQLNFIDSIPKFEDTLILLDEVDMGLSIRSIYKLVRNLKKSIKCNNQILIATHHPLLMESFDVVLSIEHKTWMKSDSFIAKHKSKGK